MAKYLIQDIIPPEKKHRSAKKKLGVEHEKIHDVVSHVPPEVEGIKITPQTHHVHNIHDKETGEVFSQNPRMILAEQLHDDESAPTSALHYPQHEFTQHDEEHPSGNSTADDEDAKNITHESHIPKFPEYSSRRIAFGSGDNKWLPWLIGLGIIGIVTIIILNFFSGATITLVPKHDLIPLDQTMTALKDPQNGELAYAVMKISASSTQEVPATGTKTVTVKASGRIIIFNQQGVTQRLIRNTRFQSTAGKIYRINESVNIPKAGVKGGKTTLGSTEVTVYAEEAGPEYNSDPTDFTVPGLKGMAQYEKVYARSKGPITGGASGTIKTVSDQDLKQAADDLRVALETKLRSKARADLSPTQIGYDQGIVLELNDPALSTTKASSEDKAVVAQGGVLYMIAFDRTQLTKAIAKIVLPSYGGEEVEISNLDSLTFSMSAQKGDALWNQNSLSFSLKGTPELKWVIDKDSIVKELLGVSKQNFNEILAKYPMVERAKAVLRPFWKSTFPKDPSRIKVEIVDATNDSIGDGNTK